MAAPTLRKPVTQGGKGPSKRETQLMKSWLPEVAIDAEGLWPAGGTAYALYDFASDGGAVGAIDLGVSLPANCIVTGITTEEVTNVTSGTSAATIKIQHGSTDLTADLALTAFAGVSQHTVASYTKPTAAANMKITVGTEAVTAGKVKIFVSYVVCA